MHSFMQYCFFLNFYVQCKKFIFTFAPTLQGKYRGRIWFDCNRLKKC